MSKVTISGNASGTGTLTIAAPNTNSDITLNLPTTMGTNNGSSVVTTDAAGNLGLGVAPSAWGSAYKASQFNSVGAVSADTATVVLSNNSYWNGSVNKYLTSTTASNYVQNSGQHTWGSAVSGTAGNNIAFTQTLSVGLGTSLALQGATSQSGTGITFPATQSASGNANTLDDYEEGTFSPGIDGWTGTYSTQFGVYTKIGNLVYCFGRVVTNGGTGTFAGSFPGIVTFPFPGGVTGSAAKGMWFVVTGATGLSSTETASGALDGPGNGNTSTFPNWIVTGGNVTNWPNTKLNSTVAVEYRFFCTYTTA